MPTVTRADCTTVASVSETYTLSITDTDPSGLGLQLTDADIQYGPCDGDLSSHYKQVNAGNTPTAIDAKLVGEGNCTDAIDADMRAYGYKRSVLEVRKAYFTPKDVSPARVTVAFNVAIEDAHDISSFKVYDASDPSTELAIASAAMKLGNTAVELTLSSAPSSTAGYRVSNLVRLHKLIAPMVTLEADGDDTGYDIFETSWDYLQIGPDWRVARVCESCSESHFSVSFPNDLMTAQIFRGTGTTHPGPTSDFNGWDDIDSLSGPTYSTNGITFGDMAVQVRDWRIRQIDDTHLSVSHANGQVARIYRADGTVHGNVQDFSGYVQPLGEPSCAYLAASYLQVGDWRIGRYDAAHLSVGHRLGLTSAIYHADGTVHTGRPRRDFNPWTFPDEEAVMGSSEGCPPLDPPEPNVLQIGDNWRLGQMVDGNHLSVSSRQPEGQTLNAAQTAMIFNSAGTANRGPRVDYNAWGEVPTYSDSPPRFGRRTLEIGWWRIRQIDPTHLSVTHENGNVARIYRADGTVHGSVNGFSGYVDPALGDPTCAFRTDRFVQLGDWRLAEINDQSVDISFDQVMSVSHRDGQTSAIYKRDGSFHTGPRTDYNGWGLSIGAILEGSAEGCASMSDASFVPFENGVSQAKVLVKFNVDLSANAEGIPDMFKVYDAANATSELVIAGAALKSRDDSTLELTLSSEPSPGVSYQVSAVAAVPTKDPLETVAAGSALDVATMSWDFIQIGNWRLARTCESCSNSHFSVSSDNMMTSQIFRDTGTTHPGPRSDYNGWDTATHRGPTYSAVGVQFGHFGVQVRDWRIRQMDQTHLSVTHENGNVARIYRADGTVHGRVNSYSGYKTPLGAPACAYLSDDYLQVGDWHFGKFSGNHLSVAHRLGKTAMIYRGSDGILHPGPRTDFNGWDLPEGEVLLGSSEGCETSPLFG